MTTLSNVRSIVTLPISADRADYCHTEAAGCPVVVDRIDGMPIMCAEDVDTCTEHGSVVPQAPTQIVLHTSGANPARTILAAASAKTRRRVILEILE